MVYINSDRLKTQMRDRYIVTEVGDALCKVQKFVGSQLRARTYTVNRSDILSIPTWTFPALEESVSDDDDDDHIVNQVPTQTPNEPEEPEERQHIAVREVPDDHDASDVDVESEDEAPELVTRYGRKIRPPRKLNDYTV